MYQSLSFWKVFKKFLRADAELCVIFGSKMAHLFWTKFFLLQTVIITFIYLLALFIVQNLKKILTADPELWCTILGPKWSICPNENSFRKPVNKSCSFHSCLSTCQKSKSDIHLLMKYWRLKNTEISMAERHFWCLWHWLVWTSIGHTKTKNKIIKSLNPEVSNSVKKAKIIHITLLKILLFKTFCNLIGHEGVADLKTKITVSIRYFLR